MEESPTKVEGSKQPGGYKSWKKKYRKMRITFDQKMHDGEELHKQEDKTAAMVKRLAVENDRLLDLLLEINNSSQIPLDKRIDVSLKPSADVKDTLLPIDKEYASRKEAALKRLEQLLTDVPHTSYSAAKASKSSSVEDLVTEDDARPASFLAADDVDDYTYAIDSSIDKEVHIPTLAPAAHRTAAAAASSPHLKNPTSVTNWLRKHAPKIFLQDGETHGGGGGGADEADGGEAGHTATGRKSRGGRGERGGKSSTRGKRASTSSRAAAVDRSGDWDGSMDEDADYGTPVGRGKRKRDDDGGYRPGGSTSRPSKKKRKSEGEGVGSARKSKKDVVVKEE